MKILVVDDDQAMNRLLCLFLERQGYEVHAAADALQALDALDRVDGFGLAIVDLLMPHVDGIQLVREIKAHARHGDLPVIMISATQDDAKVDQSMRVGAGLFLGKPVDFDRLLALVKFAA